MLLQHKLKFRPVSWQPSWWKTPFVFCRFFEFEFLMWRRKKQKRFWEAGGDTIFFLFKFPGVDCSPWSASWFLIDLRPVSQSDASATVETSCGPRDATTRRRHVVIVKMPHIQDFHTKWREKRDKKAETYAKHHLFVSKWECLRCQEECLLKLKAKHWIFVSKQNILLAAYEYSYTRRACVWENTKFCRIWFGFFWNKPSWESISVFGEKGWVQEFSRQDFCDCWCCRVPQQFKLILVTEWVKVEGMYVPTYLDTALQSLFWAIWAGNCFWSSLVAGSFCTKMETSLLTLKTHQRTMFLCPKGILILPKRLKLLTKDLALLRQTLLIQTIPESGPRFLARFRQQASTCHFEQSSSCSQRLVSRSDLGQFYCREFLLPLKT